MLADYNHNGFSKLKYGMIFQKEILVIYGPNRPTPKEAPDE